MDSSQQSKVKHPLTDNSVFATVEFIIGQIAKTIVVFFRFDFGERYFNVGMFGATVGAFIIFSFAINMLFSGLLTTAERDPSGFITANFAPLGAFFLGFLAMCVIHKAAAWYAARTNRRIHSHYSGTSFITQFLVYAAQENASGTSRPTVDKAISFFTFLFSDTAFFVKRWIEPAIAIILGFLIGIFLNGQLGFWLIFSGLCLGVHEHILAKHQRDRLLDAMDAQIEAENLGKALSGNFTPRQTEGFVLPVPTYFSKEQREKLAKGMTRLEPALEAIIDQPEPQPAPKPAPKAEPKPEAKEAPKPEQKAEPKITENETKRSGLNELDLDIEAMLDKPENDQQK